MRNPHVREWTQEEVALFNSSYYQSVVEWSADLMEVLDEHTMAQKIRVGVPGANPTVNSREFAAGVLTGLIIAGQTTGFGPVDPTDQLVMAVTAGALAAAEAAGQEIVGGVPTNEEMIAYMEHHVDIANGWVSTHPYPAVTPDVEALFATMIH